MTSLRTYDKARRQILESTANGTLEAIYSKHLSKWWAAIKYSFEWSGDKG